MDINALTHILENAEDEKAVKLFLSVYSVLDDTALGMAAKNENVSIEYLSLLLQKQKEELLTIACQQESDDLLSFLLERENWLPISKCLTAVAFCTLRQNMLVQNRLSMLFYGMAQLLKQKTVMEKMSCTMRH